MNTGLTIGGLETAYDQLATAIDAVGEDKSELFLVKLALLAAQQLLRRAPADDFCAPAA